MSFRFAGRRPSALVSLAALLLGCFVIPVAAQRLAISFDEDAPGAPPDGFFFAANRQATPGLWQVTGSGVRRHLAHMGDPSITNRGIAVAGFAYHTPENVKVTTRLRLTDGDRAGGLIWRFRDANNFYFMAVVGLDRSARIFRVTGGNRIMLAGITDVQLDPETWHTMTVVHYGEEVRGVIDGIGVLRAVDRTPGEGDRAGVWSGGNTTAFFDDIVIEQALE